MSYKYLEHSTDAFIEVKAKNLEEAFLVAGKSVVETIIDLKNIQEVEKRSVKAKGRNIQNLLYNMAAIYSIDGNIGSGKSTLIKELQKNNMDQSIIFIPEPVDVWNEIKDSSGITILEEFYKNKKKWSFSFQIMAYISRLAQLKEFIKNNPGAILITERSTHTDRYVFAQMLFDDGNINEIDMQIYLRWFDEFMKDIPIKGIIYVKTLPIKCFERVKKRGRKGEIIPIEYLERCHAYHQNWLINKKNILILDGNQEYDDKNFLITKWKEKILKFVEKRKKSPELKYLKEFRNHC